MGRERGRGGEGVWEAYTFQACTPGQGVVSKGRYATGLPRMSLGICECSTAPHQADSFLLKEKHEIPCGWALKWRRRDE